MRLLHSLSEEEAARPDTYRTLISHLNHENLIVRGLAYWHLARLAPEGGRSIPYDPAGDAGQRQKAIEQWRQLIPAGKLPPRAAR
jgi:hypothetical protein